MQVAVTEIGTRACALGWQSASMHVINGPLYEQSKSSTIHATKSEGLSSCSDLDLVVLQLIGEFSSREVLMFPLERPTGDQLRKDADTLIFLLTRFLEPRVHEFRCAKVGLWRRPVKHCIPDRLLTVPVDALA